MWPSCDAWSHPRRTLVTPVQPPVRRLPGRSVGAVVTDDTAPLRLGLVTPVVSLNPRAHGEWERTATPADLVAVARAADRAGMHHLTCSQHVAVPVDVEARRGHRYFDPLATLSWLAAATEHIRLASHVLVLGLHHPLGIVKSWGTLDRLSGGRVVLGVGVGTLAEEFDLLGARFEGRGTRADEAIAAIRASWGRPVPEFHGEGLDFADMVIDPTATSGTVPIWVGGRTRRSLRRALELGDGWVPFGMDDDAVALALSWGRDRPLREPGTAFEVILTAEGLDPVAEPGACGDRLAGLAALGATMVNVRMVHRSVAECIEQVEAVTEVAAGIGAGPATW